jgi:hypothetical protein
MDLSIVATIYNSAPYIKAFYERICAIMPGLADTRAELLFLIDCDPQEEVGLLAKRLSEVFNQGTGMRFFGFSDFLPSFGLFGSAIPGSSYGNLSRSFDSDRSETIFFF